MLEPLAAISLASAIVQFVVFGSKLLIEGRELYKSIEGATEDNIWTRAHTSNLSTLIVNLQASKQSKKLSGDENLLVRLATQCEVLSRELLDILDNLELKVGTPHRRWESMRQALRSTLKSREIEEKRQRLEEIQKQVNTCLLCIISNDTSSVMLAMEDLKSTSKDLDVSLRHDFNNMRSDLLDCVRQEEFALRSMEAVVKDNRDIFEATWKQQQLALEEVLKKIDDLVTAAEDTAANKILTSLRFKEISDRCIGISDAYTKTFEWIFEADVTDFKTWLEYSNGAFWISGKAGSGKSTLMKYLSSHPKTHDILRKWGGGDVVIASFFFWNAGVKMEKTQDGLLRSLLYQVFRQCPGLIKDFLPQRWMSDPFIRDHPNPWTRQELLTALTSALDQVGMRKKFCFFIDGLDEYSEDHYGLVQALELLTRLPSVKMCVSSRPWNVFKDAYGTTPERMVRLQDFTLADMAAYVEGVLAYDHRFLALTREEPEAWLLVSEIISRAEGVFLWVHLVTKSLLRGLTEHDDTLLLRNRLNEFPTDLETYFQHILDTTDTVYKACTARTILLAIYTHKDMLPYAVELPVIALSYLPSEIEDPDFALKAPLNQISLDERRRHQKKAELRVNAWCRDILETHQADYFPTKLVKFTHRTVKDFLEAPDMQASLFKSAGTSFKPWESLCRLNFAWVKCLNGPDCDLEATSHIFELLAVAHLMEEYEEISPIEVLRQLSAAHFQALLLLTFERMRVEIKKPLSGDALCLGLGIYHELELFVRNELKALEERNIVHDAQEKAFLLYCALNSVSKGHQSNFRSRGKSVLSIALNLGANPNTIILKRGSQLFSPWQMFLQDIFDNRYETYDLLKTWGGHIDDFANILLVLLQQGADPEVIVAARHIISENPSVAAPLEDLVADEADEVEAKQQIKESMTAKECIKWLFSQFHLTHHFSEIEKVIRESEVLLS
ncbi:hypothetical protein GJ744_011418 [Endocarpon pusillum]|uniref:NACHT domain-containing protein n=1 Tax=Endocarpon pusillum TaxID=364733 RepID=A0A8H7AGR2_9EURO|nr:hypothetical protein GJ744_011418 [Endocarpon pusillum]